MCFDAFDQRFVHRRTVAGGAEGAIIAEPSGAARYLAGFHRGEIAPPAPIIFREARKGDMFCV